ncbi:hypothetical protein CASFOL_006366 [Castilleja foliolosa]|uniref:Uncharacterized protein n=1 Tax=Castilleja foliolosa TaxID=1961234 RepID=A0ABD3E667_9LAMI
MYGLTSMYFADKSDWSIGWLEPHAPGFHSDGDTDDSFAVLVPCYRHDSQEFVENGVEFMGGVTNSPIGFSDGWGFIY